MARFDGCCLGPAEESYAHDEEGDHQYNGLSESHDYSLHRYGYMALSVPDMWEK